MIIIQVEGGLGNQMFQCALALSFIDKGIHTRLDISKYETQVSHNGYELEKVFGINLPYCTKNERLFIKGLSKLRHKLFNTPYKEKAAWQWHHHAAVNTITSGYLKGYWQCEKYFADAAGLIREKFSFRDVEDEQNKAALEKIKSCNAVSLHIRRGDYLHANVAALLDPGYYNLAINHINSKVSDPVFFVFSDDIEWAKENIKEQRVEFIGWNKGENSYIDMQLMSNCKHNIIANSSFSWWGAWLNNEPGKIVVAPQQWMRHLENGSEVIPGTWIQVPNHF